uniref:Ornithine decarboxylase antizyme n=1 Tax=Strongyloides venezuelensis TaxID=75913 RepID=A0A0K0F6X4_STRVS
MNYINLSLLYLSFICIQRFHTFLKINKMDNKLIFSENKQEFSNTVSEVNQNFTNLVEDDIHKELVRRAGELVKNVDKDWNGSYLEDENSYAVYMSNHDVLYTVSRTKFIEFFEHCDELLKVRCIYMCFDKQKIFKERFGIPFALRSIGFKMLNPDECPASIDKSSYVVMRYRLYI